MTGSGSYEGREERFSSLSLREPSASAGALLSLIGSGRPAAPVDLNESGPPKRPHEHDGASRRLTSIFDGALRRLIHD